MLNDMKKSTVAVPMWLRVLLAARAIIRRLRACLEKEEGVKSVQDLEMPKHPGQDKD